MLRLSLAAVESRDGRRELDKEPRTKANGVTATILFISASLGEPALKSILATFHSKEISGKKLPPSEWISEKTYHHLLVAAGMHLTSTPGQKTPRNLFFELGRFGAIDGINKCH